MARPLKSGIHEYMLRYQLEEAYALLDVAISYSLISGSLMSDMFLEKAADLELIALGYPPRYYTRAGQSFDEYLRLEVAWLPKFHTQRALPPPKETPMYVEKPRRKDYIAFGTL